MNSIVYLAAVTSCQKTSTAATITGSVILLAVIGGIVAAVIANANARSKLAAANTELAYLRPENARLHQWVASMTGSPVHDAYSSGYTTGPPRPSQWHPDPSGRHQHRLWDGAQWRDQVSDDGVISIDPVDR
jgi:Protein of unknown function (DUF2510)